MKNTVKTMLICMVILLLAANPAFSENTLETLKTNVDGFIDDFAYSLPFYSTLGLNWSDAYVGKMPSGIGFGAGIAAGFTTMDFSSVYNLLNMFNLDIPVENTASFQNTGLPFPGYAAEFRIGGIGIPMDFGIKYSYISPSLFDSFTGNFSNTPSFSLNHMLIGADIRFTPVMMKVFPLNISFGFGFNYLTGGIKATIPSGDASFTFSDGIRQLTLNPADPQLGIEWKTFNVELKTQVSFPLKFFTPYTGIGLSYAQSEAGYRVSSGLSVTDSYGSPVSLNSVEDTLKSFGLTGVSETGFETIKKENSFNMRVFGGFSFNLAFIRLDLTGMYNILGGNLGASLGLRFQM